MTISQARKKDEYKYEPQANHTVDSGNRAQLGLVGVRGPSESHADSGRKSASTKSGHDGSSDSGGADADRGHAHRDAHSHRDARTNAYAGHAYGNVQSHRDVYGHADIHSHRDGCSNADAGDTYGDSHPYGLWPRQPRLFHSHRNANAGRAHVYTHTYCHHGPFAHSDPCGRRPAGRHFGSG